MYPFKNDDRILKMSRVMYYLKNRRNLIHKQFVVVLFNVPLSTFFPLNNMRRKRRYIDISNGYINI